MADASCLWRVASRFTADTGQWTAAETGVRND
jgi:hypothetical protein